MSALVLEALARAGLAEVAEVRARGDWARLAEFTAQVTSADLLVLGALSDRIRVAEVGDAVRIYANVLPDDGPEVIDVHATRGSVTAAPLGMDLLRAVAVARVLGPRAARVRVDWSKAGLELSQVALGFGASELVGPVSSKRGLLIADDAEKKIKGQGMVSVQELKQREIEALVRRCGRVPELVTARGREAGQASKVAVGGSV